MSESSSSILPCDPKILPLSGVPRATRPAPHRTTHTHTHTHTPPGPTLLMRYPMSHLSQMALNTTCEKDGAYAVTHMTSEETATSRPHHTQGRCHLHLMPIVTKPAAT